MTTDPREPFAETADESPLGAPTRRPRALELALGVQGQLEAQLGRLDEHDLEQLVAASRYARHGVPELVAPGDLEAFRRARRT